MRRCEVAHSRSRGTRIGTTFMILHRIWGEEGRRATQRGTKRGVDSPLLHRREGIKLHVGQRCIFRSIHAACLGQFTSHGDRRTERPIYHRPSKHGGNWWHFLDLLLYLPPFVTAAAYGGGHSLAQLGIRAANSMLSAFRYVPKAHDNFTIPIFFVRLILCRIILRFLLSPIRLSSNDSPRRR